MPVICAMEPKSTSLTATKKVLLAYLPAVLITIGVAVLSLWERPYLPPPVWSLGDKVLHGLMYTAMAVTWMIPVVKYPISNIQSPIIQSISVWFGVTAYGALMEIMQRYCTQTRSGEMADVYADAIGALLGVAVVMVIVKLKK